MFKIYINYILEIITILNYITVTYQKRKEILSLRKQKLKIYGRKQDMCILFT